jgi:hypothetical protein
LAVAIVLPSVQDAE